MKYKEIDELVDTLMDETDEVKNVLFTLNNESDLNMLYEVIEDIIFETSLADNMKIYDRAINIREEITLELNGRSLEEYKEKSYYELDKETIEKTLNFSDDEYREKWLEDLLNVELKGINTESDKDLITLQKEVLEAKSNNRPINENPRAMFLILKYYKENGALFAIGDSLRNNPHFMERIINDYPEALDLTLVDEATWAEVARISNDDKLKSNLLNKRLMERLKYEILTYYEENSERYGLKDILEYKGYLEDEDIPYSDCNDVRLLEYVIKQKGERGEPIIPAKELSKYYGLVAQRDDNLKTITLRAMEEETMEMSELQKREKKLSALEKEEKTIIEAQELIEKQNKKDGQDIGE